jgi:hypothetical protein
MGSAFVSNDQCPSNEFSLQFYKQVFRVNRLSYRSINYIYIGRQGPQLSKYNDKATGWTTARGIVISFRHVKEIFLSSREIKLALVFP